MNPTPPTTLTPSAIKTLEQTRQRLSLLNNSLIAFQASIVQHDPLPEWTSFKSSATIISQSLASLSTHLSTNAPLLSRMAVYPLPSFPGRTQEGLLQQLLRKKLEPGVEEWVEEGRRGGGVGMDDKEDEGGEGEGGGGGKVDMGKKEEGALTELWAWAGGAANEEARMYVWGGGGEGGSGDEEEDSEEGEGEGEEQEEEGEGEDGDVMDIDSGGVGKGGEKVALVPVPVAEVLRFMMTGVVPRGRG
ncbi:mediator of RNA polymerase II transcription subunit 8 [Varicellaria rhodocarpa]|nr:mediator of RNA polymerase II transcription subunit 8 [Varicellaria rhodocarpa]